MLALTDTQLADLMAAAAKLPVAKRGELLQRLAAKVEAITLRCRSCGKRIKYARDVDPAIPANVVLIEQGCCTSCWHGDRDYETWYDAVGHEVSQDPRA